MHAFWTLQTDSEASEEVGRQPPFTGLPRIAPAFIGLSRWLLNDPPKWWTVLRLGRNGIQEVTGSIPVSSTGFFHLARNLPQISAQIFFRSDQSIRRRSPL